MLAAIASSMLINYITESQQNIVDNAASTIDKFLTEQINRENVSDLGEYISQNKASIQPSLKMFSKYASDLTIFITDDEGNILITDGAHNKYYSGSKIPMEYIENAHKPSVKNYQEACRRMGIKEEQAVFVGDQLFTDVYGAKRTGLYNILTEPINPKEEIQIVLKRYLEHIVLFFYERDLARGRITKKNS